MTTTNMNALFSAAEQMNVTGGANQLDKTAQLTAIAGEVATNIINQINTNIEELRPQVVGSQQSHDAMDELIGQLFDLDEINIQFLRDESEDTLEKMIKSQQSKRSRAKSKVMTLDNYRTMMIGAIAENLLRSALGKPKSAGVGRSYNSEGFTEEQLQELANDQEALKKAIRNVQSKKSIMKSKAGFDEESERWLQLLADEEALKSLRVGGSNPEATKAVEVTQKIDEMLATTDLEKLKAADAKDMLTMIREMLSK